MKKNQIFEQMIEQAKEAIIDSSSDSSVYIGCDSLRHKKNGTWHASYSTVIVLHIGSKHGGRIFSFTETIPDYGSMKQRLLNEVAYAVRAASEIVDHIDDRPFEIHLDLNSDPKHKSNIAVKEAVGYVRGTFGFDPKIKPLAWASTHASDHIVRH